MSALRGARRALAGGLALCLGLTLCIDIAILVVPIYDMQLYDRVLQSRNLDTVLLLSLACAAGLGLYGLLDLLRSAALLAIADGVARLLRAPVLRHALQLGLSGEDAAAAQAMRDIGELRGFLASGAVCVPLDALCAPVLLTVLFLLHPAFGWLGCAGAALLVGLGLLAECLARPGLAAAGARQDRAAGELARHLHDPDVAEGLGMLPALARRWQARHGAAQAQAARAQARGQALAGAAKFARLGLAAGVMVLGARMILTHATTPGSLMGANLLLAKMLGPFDHLVASWRHWALALAAWRRLAALDLAPPAPTPARATPGPPGLCLRDVGYTPPGHARPVLANLSFAVAPGQALGVVGANGAGKSTLLRLLAGLLVPGEGDIGLDGVPVAGGPRVGYLPQTVALLDGSVGDNIARFAPAMTDAAIAAARQAGVHGLIGRLRQGYDTELGSDGAALSGGQRQRIGLARALFGRPRLLVLDEPDASLDHDGDAALLAAIAAARAQGSVVVLTTHRPRLLAAMDVVLTLQEGRMQSFGPPPQSLAA